MTADSRQQTTEGKRRPAKTAKKPPARTVASDDCVVTVAGVEYHPHEDEWVKVLGSSTVQNLRVLRAFDGLQVQLDALEGEDDATHRKLALMDESHEDAIALMQDRIVEWNWTDMRGRPLPQPSDDPTVFRGLEIEELWYLVMVLQGETPGERKNGSRPSRTSSSATAPQPSQA